MGSPVSTTSSSSSTMPKAIDPSWLKRAIFMGSVLGETLGVEPGEPAVPVGHAAVLNVGELLAKSHRDLSGRGIGIPNANAVTLELADRGDHGSGSARENLGDVAGFDAEAPLLERHLALLHGHAPVAGELHDAVAGDAFQNRAGELRRHERVLPVHEEHVHSAELVDVGSGLAVEEEHLG